MLHVCVYDLLALRSGSVFVTLRDLMYFSIAMTEDPVRSFKARIAAVYIKQRCKYKTLPDLLRSLTIICYGIIEKGKYEDLSHLTNQETLHHTTHQMQHRSTVQVYVALWIMSHRHHEHSALKIFESQLIERSYRTI